nr:VOC family protein [Rhizobium acidisoli]
MATVDVDDVDQSAKDFVANGGSVRRPPDDIPGIGRFAVVADPHGAVLCIMTPAPMDKTWPELAPDAPGNIGWHVSGVKVEGMPTYTIFEANGIGVAGLMEFPAELEGKGIPPNWTGYVVINSHQMNFPCVSDIVLSL